MERGEARFTRTNGVFDVKAAALEIKRAEIRVEKRMIDLIDSV